MTEEKSKTSNKGVITHENITKLAYEATQAIKILITHKVNERDMLNNNLLNKEKRSLNKTKKPISSDKKTTGI
jgi:hypothetical protein